MVAVKVVETLVGNDQRYDLKNEPLLRCGVCAVCVCGTVCGCLGGVGCGWGLSAHFRQLHASHQAVIEFVTTP